MQQETTTREALVDRIRRDRERFDAILARVPRERLEELGLAAEGWSVKDVLWHIAWGDRQSWGVARAKALIGSDLWQLSEDERNAAVVREGRSRSLDDVLREYGDSYEELMTELGRLSDPDLNDAGRWDGLAQAIPGWRPWRVLYDPKHYDEHGGWIAERLR